ncbi:hypothetical protein FOL47_001848 [Perkinsus chesapeaki]|uniref:Uncharacterized protein n=1 Tax=Perkinsus chesapeaki TaxID=330153 RepID=A0A7J6KT39_PERCH|nr:hypothetical protein FOL47_001848 [Perkinsus chesapeaki]
MAMVALEMLVGAYLTYQSGNKGVLFFDYDPGYMLPILRTKNLLYKPLQIDYDTSGLNIEMNRSKLLDNFPYIDPGFTLRYADHKKAKVLLQHAQQPPYVFNRTPESRLLRGDSGQPDLLESRTFLGRKMEGCYKVSQPELGAGLTLFTNGELNLEVTGKIRLRPYEVLYSTLLFCNVTRAGDNTIVAEGWSTDVFPYVYAPWTLHHPHEDNSTMVLSLGNGLEYTLTKDEDCKYPVETCFS